MLIAEIHLLYENGEDDIIASDETWLYKGSDTEMSDIYDGEIRNLLLWEDRENPFQVPCIGQRKGNLTERYRNGKRGHCREGNHPYPGRGNGT